MFKNVIILFTLLFMIDSALAIKIPISVTIQSIVANTLGVVTNNTINSSYTSVTAVYPNAFRIVPSVVMTIVNYLDQTPNQDHVTTGVYLNSIGQVQAVFTYVYFSSVYYFPFKFRLRYFVWDHTIYTNIQTKEIYFNLNYAQTGTVDILANFGDATQAKHYCFLLVIYNLKQLPDNSLDFQCVSQAKSSQIIQASVTINAIKGVLVSDRYIWGRVLIIFPLSTISLMSGLLDSTYGSPSFTTTNNNCPTCYYIAGYNYIRTIDTRAFSFALDDNDRNIVPVLNYQRVKFGWINFAFTKNTDMMIYSMSTNFYYSKLVIGYNNIGNESFTVDNFDPPNGFIVQNINQIVAASILQLTLSYPKSAVGNFNQIIFWWKYQKIGYKTKIATKISEMQTIKIDTLTNTVEFKFTYLTGTDLSQYYITQNTYAIVQDFHSSSGSTFMNATLTQQSYNNAFSIIIDYPNQNNYKLGFNGMLFKVVSIEIFLNKSITQIILWRAAYQYSDSQLSFSPSQFNIDYIKLNNDGSISLFLNNDFDHFLTSFDLIYTPNATENTLTIQNIHVHLVEVKQMNVFTNNTVQMVLKNPHNHVMDKNELIFQHLTLIMQSVDLDLTKQLLNITFSFNKTFKGINGTLVYSNTLLGYPHKITMDFFPNTQFPFWNQSALKVYPTLYKIGEILQYIYLTMFTISLLCNKLLGAQTMYMIQLAYYTLIPINIYNSSFLFSQKSLKYVSGWNPLFDSLSSLSQPTIQNYLSLEIKSNFFSNLNLMFFPILIFPIMFGILYGMSQKTNHYRTKPRLMMLSMVFLLELPLAIMLFNAFNIYTSTVITIEYQNSNNLFSVVTSIIISLILPILLILLTVFQKYFTEFNKQISEVDHIWKIDKIKSTRIRKLYPLFFGIQIILVSIFLSVESLFEKGLYLSLTIIILMSIYILISTPYAHQIENLRLLIYRLIILIIIILQVITKSQIQKGKTLQGIVVYQPWIISSLLTIGIILNGFFIIKNTISWFRKKPAIDIKLYVQQKGTNIKVKNDFPVENGVSFPKLQYGVGRGKIIANAKKQSLNMRPKKKQLQKQLLDVTKQQFQNSYYDAQEN